MDLKAKELIGVLNANCSDELKEKVLNQINFFIKEEPKPTVEVEPEEDAPKPLNLIHPKDACDSRKAANILRIDYQTLVARMKSKDWQIALRAFRPCDTPGTRWKFDRQHLHTVAAIAGNKQMRASTLIDELTVRGKLNLPVDSQNKAILNGHGHA